MQTLNLAHGILLPSKDGIMSKRVGSYMLHRMV
jgi:hypothetical protein